MLFARSKLGILTDSSHDQSDRVTINGTSPPSVFHTNFCVPGQDTLLFNVWMVQRTRPKSYGTSFPLSRRTIYAHPHSSEQTEEIATDASGSTSGADSSTSAVSLSAFIPHSVPPSMELDSVSFFLKDRERYELEVEQRKTELPILTVARYTSSIDRKLLKHMVSLGEFYEIAPEKSAEKHSSEEIILFINGIVKKTSSGFDPTAQRKLWSVSGWRWTWKIMTDVYFI